MDETRPPITEDRILGGRALILQPAKGYRAGLDAALLAAACDGPDGARILEFGCGVGGALIAAALRRPRASFVGVERDVAAAALARRNVTANGLEDRVSVREGVVEAADLAGFDAVMANPPFFDDPGALRAPHPAKRGAWIADAGLEAWIGAMLAAARDGGTLLLIHRADRLADILAQLAPKAGSVRIRPVHPFADAPAKRVLVRAVRGGRAPLVLLPPLVLHARGGAKHTDEAEAILRGERDLGWD